MVASASYAEYFGRHDPPGGRAGYSAVEMAQVQRPHHPRWRAAPFSCATHDHATRLDMHVFVAIGLMLSIIGCGGASLCFDQGSPCRTIAHAVAAATAGEIIQIAAGSYTESVTIDKSLALRGAGRDDTFIQAHEEPGGSHATRDRRRW